MKNSIINNFKFNGKTIFVVGGLGLIGEEVTNELANLGAKIVIIDNNYLKFIKNKKSKKTFSTIFFEKLDLRNTKAIKKTYNKIIKKHGCPDVFVNCSYPRTSDWPKNNFTKISLESLTKNINYHLVTYTYLARTTAEFMKKKRKKSGSIILLGSIYGVLGQDLNIYKGTNIKENVSYSVIKGGIVNLSKQMASYYGSSNIRVNTVCPGGIFDNQNKKFIKNYSRKVPLKRLATKEEIAKVIVFLASEASSYITGATIMADGGWSAI